MKAVAFKDNAAVIAGHRVPYSLLGAAAAILGAFLIWKFNQSGGLSLGTTPASTDPLASLLGNAYTPTDYTTPPGSTAGFAGGGSYPSSPTPAYVAPTIDYGPASSSYYSTPVYAAAPAAASPITKSTDPGTSLAQAIATYPQGTAQQWAPIGPQATLAATVTALAASPGVSRWFPGLATAPAPAAAPAPTPGPLAQAVQTKATLTKLSRLN